ncbi:unnamed protein product [Rotaria magnacalcarata]|uniref:EF-hand domain-containing protein n=1 Tax=Rotaria magnacalcarata TaxID=392030 RepID=A0A816FFM1_9BILA|nr:unnamed protein product [Rotaria magnacalcarata]CAF1660886.1 unnamed protein product [Rotaria magnacalcarata]CAF1966915.1 unnamed protein product [Rotaria magnacalcarata]CAF1973589.1 unnamed protein product [Rotaria magnacalcarata]CAF2111110.1 unnamed protein product [Rotaria magnacalcarata]
MSNGETSDAFLQQVFRKVDADGSGAISSNELQSALSNGTWSPFNPETVRMMIGMFDRDGSSTIDFKEFRALWFYVTEWEKCFRRFDLDGSGTIDKHELKIALSSFGYRLSDRFYDLLIKKFDRSGRGTVAFDDFIQACVSIQTLTTAFSQHDHLKTGEITINYEDFLLLVFSLKTRLNSS